MIAPTLVILIQFCYLEIFEANTLFMFLQSRCILGEADCLLSYDCDGKNHCNWHTWKPRCHALSLALLPRSPSLPVLQFTLEREKNDRDT